MSETVDARGLSCPQPVMMTMDTMKKMLRGEIVVLVDTQASRENVSRAAQSQGWEVREVRKDGDEFHLYIARE